MRINEIRGFTHYKLYPGVLQRGHLDKWTNDQAEEFCARYNVKFIIGLARQENMTLRRLEKKGIIHYYFYPIPDNKLSEEAIEVLTSIVGDVTRHISGTSAVLSYCNAGRNRSGLVNALILRSLLRVSGVTALEMVREARPRAITNEHFEAYLRSLS